MASAGPADTYDPHDHPLPDSLADIAQYEPLSFPYGPKADDAFPVWKLRTESLLMAAGRWDVVTGEDVCPALDDAMSPEDKKRALRRLQRWQQRDAQARFLILQKLEDNYVPVIGQCGSAKELWERICEDHTAGSVGLRVYRIMDRILNRKYRTGTSFVDYVGEFLRDNWSLRELGHEVADTMLAMIVVRSLPWQDETLRTSLSPLLESLGKDDGKKDMDKVMDTLVQMDTWRLFRQESRKPQSGRGRGR